MKAQIKTALRLFKKHLTRLFTIVAIVVVSIGFVSGVGELEDKIVTAVNGYYHEYALSDLYIKSNSERGFTLEEQTRLEEKYGAENVRKSFSYETDEQGEITRIYSFNFKDNNVNQLTFWKAGCLKRRTKFS
jgi:hypothetical protein